MIAESIRMKVAIVFIAIIAVVLPILPFVVEGDGLTLKSRIQNYLSYSLGMTGFLLSILTIFLSCAAIHNEIQLKQIFMVVSKPIPRWQFFAGKWLGIATLNAGLLLLTGIIVTAGTYYMTTFDTNVPRDKQKIRDELITVRQNAKLVPPDFEKLVDERIRALREQNRLQEISGQTIGEVRSTLWERYKKAWRSIPPGEIQPFIFENIVIDREKESVVHLRFKPTQLSGLTDILFPTRIWAGDPDQPNTMLDWMEEDYIDRQFHTVTIDSRTVSQDGKVYLYIQNLHPRYTMLFEGNDTLELLYGIGTFPGNLSRALGIIWCRLGFLAAVGLLASSFVSFPVACMACFLVLFVSTAGGWLDDAVYWASPGVAGAREDPMGFVGPFLRILAQAFIWITPDFSKYDAVGNVVGGRLVPLLWVIQTFIKLLVLQALLVAVLGCILLSRREIGLPTS